MVDGSHKENKGHSKAVSASAQRRVRTHSACPLARSPPPPEGARLQLCQNYYSLTDRTALRAVRVGSRREGERRETPRMVPLVVIT